MLRTAIDDDGSGTGEQAEEQGREKKTGVIATNRSPTRPHNAPPSRGRRPQPNNTSNNNNNTAASRAVAAISDTGKGKGGNTEEADVDEGVKDDDSFGKDSHDLRGFDELDDTFRGVNGKAFSYDDYPAAGSPEEPVWIHTPWCGTNSGDIPVHDKIFDKVPDGVTAPPVVQLVLPASASSSPAPSPVSPEAGVNGSSTSLSIIQDDDNGAGSVEKFDGDGRKQRVEDKARGVHSPPHREQQDFDSGGEDATREQEDTATAISPLGLWEGAEEEGSDGGRRSPRGATGGGSSPRAVAGGGELKRYDWSADIVPARPSLLATSRIPMGNRADKLKSRNAKRKDTNKKVDKMGTGGVGSRDKCANRQIHTRSVRLDWSMRYWLSLPVGAAALTRHEPSYIPLAASLLSLFRSDTRVVT